MTMTLDGTTVVALAFSISWLIVSLYFLRCVMLVAALKDDTAEPASGGGMVCGHQGEGGELAWDDEDWDGPVTELPECEPKRTRRRGLGFS